MSLRHRSPGWGAVLLCCVLAGAAARAAVLSDATDLDAAPARHLDNPATASPWSQPEPASPVVVRPAAPAKPADVETVKSANPLWAIPLATLANTRDRPIFSPTRRPPPAPVAPMPVVAAPPPRPKPVKVERPQLALVGTVAGPDQSFAIFVDQSTKTALRLKVGEEYQGWRLREVAQREVTLVHDEDSAVLSLPVPEASSAQPVTMQADNTRAVADPKRVRERR